MNPPQLLTPRKKDCEDDDNAHKANCNCIALTFTAKVRSNHSTLLSIARLSLFYHNYQICIYNH